jgi:hypothetical protein
MSTQERTELLASARDVEPVPTGSLIKESQTGIHIAPLILQGLQIALHIK